MKIVIYGLTITSSWGNGHATTYRSLLKALARRGHEIIFVEKDVAWYRNDRDLPCPDFCKVLLYDEWQTDETRLIQQATDADAVVIGSYFPDAVTAATALFAKARCPVIFYDIDTPITLAGLRISGSVDYLKASMIPGFAAYLSFSNGPALTELTEHFKARRALPLFCSVDVDLYYPAERRAEFTCDLSYLGTYAADRQSKLSMYLGDTARFLPQKRFLVAGSQYPAELDWQKNVVRLVHVSPPDHSAFYSSSRFTLNLTRHDMVASGYSPSVRLFEAAACGAAILSDAWQGLDEFFTASEEILLPKDGAEVAAILRDMTEEERVRMGSRARERVLGAHTSEHRASDFERIVSECSVA